MVDGRTNLSRDISYMLRSNYENRVRIFKTEIPLAVKAAETSAEGKSIYLHDKNGKATAAYEALAKEVLYHGKQRAEHEADLSR